MSPDFPFADAVCLTVDVEWAAPEVLADLVRELDARRLKATFFCTHAGVEVPGHERALHPNFRHDGDTLRAVLAAQPQAASSDPALFRGVLAHSRPFCPEARGVRTHSLFFDLQLLAILGEAGFSYDSSVLLPLQPHIAPHRSMWGLTEVPIYYMDHFDLVNQATGFRPDGLMLDRPGLKVVDFHPNMVFINAASDAHYQQSKSVYHDAAALRAQRRPGRGVRTLFLELLDELARRGAATPTLSALHDAWRAAASAPG